MSTKKYQFADIQAISYNREDILSKLTIPLKKLLMFNI